MNNFTREAFDKGVMIFRVFFERTGFFERATRLRAQVESKQSISVVRHRRNHMVGGCLSRNVYERVLLRAAFFI